MGGECSTVLAQPTCVGTAQSCGSFEGGPSCQRVGAPSSGTLDEDGMSRRRGRPLCDVYWDGEEAADAAVVTMQGAAHPLLFLRPEDETPRTPRGPVPPWAVSPESWVDRTSTGVTPPRTHRPERASPPGIPEEIPAERENLASTLNADFVRDLFQAVRANDVTALHRLLQRAYSGGISLVASMPGGTAGGTLAASRCERVDEAVATFLSRARSPRPSGTQASETLLGAAAAAGHAEAAQLLLEARADPGGPDSRGSSALHRAAEGGDFLTVLVILDRMQAHQRSINVATLTNNEGETPEMLAALSGASEVCRAFELFSDMQDDACLRQIGHQLQPAQDMGDGSAALGPGGALSLVDLSLDAKSAEGQAASALLRRSALGGGLLRNPFRRCPEREAELGDLIAQACDGISEAEQILLCTPWDGILATPRDASRPSLGSAARRCLRTAELRSRWQRLRANALKGSLCSKSLEDFWQTHLTAEAMSTALQRCQTDVFQMLLIILWLYTREAWLFHVLEALAALLLIARGPSSRDLGEGTTGSTPSEPLELTGALRPVATMADALTPFAQLVQSALLHFEDRGVRHTGTVYQPMSVPTAALRRLLDRLSGWQRKRSEGDEREELGMGSGVWVALGAGSFFRGMSSRMEATRRLTQTRCNVLLSIRPDDWAPCFPKHLALRGASVDDVLYPLGTLFRIVRATRTVSSDLDPQNDARWPVVVLELVSSQRLLEALELLEGRGELGTGELEAVLGDWISGACYEDQHRRLFSAGELLAHCGRPVQGAALMERSALIAEARGDKVCAARTLLACARCHASCPASSSASQPAVPVPAAPAADGAAHALEAAAQPEAARAPAAASAGAQAGGAAPSAATALGTAGVDEAEAMRRAEAAASKALELFEAAVGAEGAETKVARGVLEELRST